jgi:protoporphyrinogen oxidase
MNNKKVLIIGAGFAGLAAALELDKYKIPTLIIEKSSDIGGLSRTIDVDGVKFELGPHIYFNKDEEVTNFWRNLVGDNFKTYQRNNRIFYKNKYISSPLNVLNAFIKLGPITVLKIIFSFLKSKFTSKEVTSAEDWVIINFGKQLYDKFFKVYNEKIWGINCDEISPNWAGQRIKSSLSTMVIKSVKKDENFIIKTFDFPQGGSEQLYNKQLQIINKSETIDIQLNCYPIAIIKNEDGFLVDFSTGEKNIFFSDIISTIHLNDLTNILYYDKIDKIKLKHQVSKLMYRNLVLVNLVYNIEDVKSFKEHWIDVHDANVKTLRVTNFSNYNFGLNNSNKVGVGLEYNCFDTCEIWNDDDETVTSPKNRTG